MGILSAPPQSPDHPGYLAGLYYPTFRGLRAALAVAAVDVIYLYPFRLYAAVTIKTLVLRVTTGGASSAAKQAIWANSVVSMRPLGAPLIADNTGVATTGSATNAEANTTDTFLGPGWYWAGSKYQATLPSMLAVQVSNGFCGAFMGLLSIQSVGLSFADAYANNMPTFAEGASFTEVTTSVPIIALGL